MSLALREAPPYKFSPVHLANCELWLPADRSALTRAAGMAAQFTAATSEFLSIADNASLSMGDIAMTGWLWVYMDDVTATSGLLGKWTAANLEYLLYHVAGPSRLRFLVRNTANDAQDEVIANTFGALSNATWYFVVFYHNPTTNLIGISVNDGAFDTRAWTGGIRDGTSAFVLGAQDTVPNSPLTGRMQCVGLIKQILTAAQVTALYNSGTPLAFDQLPVAIQGDATLSYWELNEESGTRVDLGPNANNLTDNNTVTSNPGTALNRASQLNDLSGNARNATQGTQADRPTIRRHSVTTRPVVQFDWGLMTLGDIAAFDFGAADFTIALWAYLDSIAVYNDFTYKYDVAGAQRGWYFRTDNVNGQLVFVTSPDGTATKAQTSANGAVSAGVWQHIAVVRVGTDVTFYVNGAAVTDDATAIDATIYAVTAPVILAAMTGEKDDFAIFSRALSAADVKLLAQGRGESRRKYGVLI